MLSKKELNPFVISHLVPLTEYVYQLLKQVEKGEFRHEHMVFQIIRYISTHRKTFFLLCNSEDLERVENMILFCIKQMEEGKYKPCGCRGLLNETNTAFLDHFDKYIRIIIEQRHADPECY